MIDQSINELMRRLQLQTVTPDPNTRMRNFKTIKKGAYENVPPRECPMLTCAWDDNLSMSGWMPVESSFGVDLVIWSSSTRSPDEASTEATKLLMYLESDGTLSGLLPAVCSIPFITIGAGPASMNLRVTPQYKSTSVQKHDSTSIYLGQIIVAVEFDTMIERQKFT